MDLKEMKLRKKAMKLTNEELARRAGLPLSTVQKLMAGQTRSPRYETMVALEGVLTPKKNDPFGDPLGNQCEYYFHPDDRREDGTVRDGAIAYKSKRQGEYTVEDLEDMPEEWRGELIDGVIYDLASPLNGHQLAVGWFYFEMKSFLRARKAPCRLFLPIGVQLGCDNRTLVEPDLVVTCDDNKLRKRGLWGCPDLVIEVLSPSTRKKDITIKSEKYRKAGVKEYWMVDLEYERVIAYRFDEDDVMRIYSFQEEITVKLWNEECALDLRQLKDELDELEDVTDESQEWMGPSRNVEDLPPLPPIPFPPEDL